MAAAVAVAEQQATEYAPASPEGASTQYHGSAVQSGGFRPEGKLAHEWLLRSDDQEFAHPNVHGAPELAAETRAALSSPRVTNRIIPAAPLYAYGPGEKVFLPPPEPAPVGVPAPGNVTQVIESQWGEWGEGPAEFDGSGWGAWTAVPAGVSGDVFVGGSGPEWTQGKPRGGAFGYSSDNDGWVVHGYSGDIQGLPAPLAHELTVSPPFWGPGPPPAGY